MSSCNGAVRPRKPQLADSIDRLDRMVDDLSVAIPGAVADSVREALGPALVAAVTDAVRAALSEALATTLTGALNGAVERAVAEATEAARSAVPPQPAAVQPVAVPVPPAPRVSLRTRVRALLGRVRRAAARLVAPAVARIGLGWAIAKVIGGATLRSRAAALVTATAGTGAGLLGYALGPVGAAALLAVVAATVAAACAWAAPTVRLFLALRDG